MQKKCKELGLEEELRLYKIRLWKSYLSIFYFLHTLLTVSHCILLLATCEPVELIYIDVIIYCGCTIVVFIILSINFHDSLVLRHTWVMFTSSMLAVFIFIICDLIQTIYHDKYNNWKLGSFYDTYIIFMIYMFMPIHFIFGPIILGFMVSAIYVAFYYFYARTGIPMFITQLITSSALWSDILHYVCTNLVGIFFRKLNDIVVRASFLDRHQYIKEELWLRNARVQEKMLVDSILPTQISDYLHFNIERKIKMAKLGRRFIGRDLPIQMHPDVSILYADVVNYTHLTTTLTVEKLVQLLHDLYGRFDRAASHFQVQRIKFLGDCYYCVAGLVTPDPDHASKCVALALDMIWDIQEVRDIQKLDINMRIGVHSGILYAGIIGDAKLQFDIWGLDVTIANVLESTGLAGFVHISNTTLAHLDQDVYEIVDGPQKAVDHPLLQKHKIQTYIIQSAPSVEKRCTSLTLDNMSNLKMMSRPDLHNHESDSLANIFAAELHEEFRKMPVSPVMFSKYRHIKQDKETRLPVNKMCLHFKDADMENAYLYQKDYMFKYSILLVWCIAMCLIFIQWVDKSNFSFTEIILDVLIIVTFSIITFIAWYKHFCWRIWGRHNKPHKYRRFSCVVLYVLESIQNRKNLRICVYLFLTLMNFLVILQIMFHCDLRQLILIKVEASIFHYDASHIECFNPWILTNLVAVIIIMTITFTRIPFVIRTIVFTIEVVMYSVMVLFNYNFNFHHSVTSNPNLQAEYAHVMLILVTATTSYLKERQIEFANRINFKWKRELEKKEKDAVLTNQSIIILLNNILPNHVVELYLNSMAKNELYFENYKMVSVMFAMLVNFNIELSSLRFLNEIITEFDMLLLYYREFYVVEKIKVVNCTYMAACGLDLNFVKATSIPLHRSDSHDVAEQNRIDLEEVVFVMVSFALDMMRTLEKCKKEYQKVKALQHISIGSIEIGLSSGEVMAGIVGASHPHYDIWGNAVNMASRMQSTGLPGHIQVTEESANILQDFGIYCEYRGQTFVKGRGEIPTYMVGINENLDFIEISSKRVPRHLERSRLISYDGLYSMAYSDARRSSQLALREERQNQSF
ncbi:hypothetical protein KR018_005160, partial [Drosophila ironensis]